MWQFRKADENIHVVRRNVRFTADGEPARRGCEGGLYRQRAVQPADRHQGPEGGDLVDLTPVFMSDLPQIGLCCRASCSRREVDLGAASRALTKNVELEVAATYASSGKADIESVPDRAV